MCDVKKAKSIFLNPFDEGQVPEVISEEVDLPPLDPYSVLVRVKSCGLSVGLRDPRLPRVLAKNQDSSRVAAGASVAGIVAAVGDAVTALAEGDYVVGIIPLDSGQSGCSDYVVLGEHELCPKPPGVSWVDAAGCVDDAFKAYVALNYLGRLTPGDTALIVGGATSVGSLCVQLAHHWGAKVITTCANEDEKRYLQAVNADLAQIVQLGDKTNSLKTAVMLETGNMGVDVAVDQGVIQFKGEGESPADVSGLPTKHEMISCLAVGGRWVTPTSDLQLDPPDTAQLFLRCAGVSLLFEQAWLLSAVQQGRYQHILHDVLHKLDTKVISPNIHHTVSFDQVAGALTSLIQHRVGRVVMTSLP